MTFSAPSTKKKNSAANAENVRIMIVARITVSRDGHTILNHSLRTDLTQSIIFFINSPTIFDHQIPRNPPLFQKHEQAMFWGFSGRGKRNVRTDASPLVRMSPRCACKIQLVSEHQFTHSGSLPFTTTKPKFPKTWTSHVLGNFWQGQKESNPYPRFWRPIFYR